MTRRRSKARLWLAVTGLVLLAINVAVLAAFTWPRLTRVRRAESRAAEVATQRASLERLWAQVIARKELVAQNRKDIESLSRDYLKPRAVDLFAAQREIEKLAIDAGLQPKKSGYDVDQIKGTNLVRVEVTLPLDGTYANLTGFLARIAAAKRFIVVDQMSLTQDQEAAKMSLKLRAVFTDGAPLESR